MANVISSLRTVQARLLAVWQAQEATKTRQQAAQTTTSRATTSFRALLSGKATSAALPAAQGGPLGAAQAVAPAAAALPASQAVATAAAALTTTQTTVPAVAADTPAQNTAPTAESIFGPNPWMTDPTATQPDGSTVPYNPYFFGTAATAATLAQMVGGTVVATDPINVGGFSQNQPTEMVQLADGTLVNAGAVASIYTHGYPQSYIDQLLVKELGGSAT